MTGLAASFRESLSTKLQNNKFSLNIDEATSENRHKVLAILASYYDPEKKLVVVDHLESREIIKGDSKTIHRVVVDVLRDNNVPFSNLISMLMDSCSVMRGRKSGVETRIRSENAPHLIDIDGDTCHHVHNACKALTKPFGKFVEQLATDIHNDVKWSADLKDYMSDMASSLGMKFTMPTSYAATRWLSLYDVCLEISRMLDVYLIFYFSFMSNNDQRHYRYTLQEIYLRRGVKADTERGLSVIKDIQQKLTEKKLTNDGKDRKSRIWDKLFNQKRRLLLYVEFFNAVCPLLKQYTLMFESKEPLIHKLYDEQNRLLQGYLGLFIKPELLTGSGRQLAEVDLEKPANQLNKNTIFVGKKARAVIEKNPKSAVVHEFVPLALAGFIACGKVLQTKMPVQNKLLLYMSALDPVVKGSTSAMSYMSKLPSLMTNVLSNVDEEELYDIEVRQFHSDIHFSPPEEPMRLDVWWTPVFGSSRFPMLSKIVKAAMSCFHGPQVEGSFSIMKQVMNTQTSQLNVETFSSIQSIKYPLKVAGKSASEFFGKSDFLHQHPDPSVVRHLNSAAQENKKRLTERAEAKKKTLLPGATATVKAQEIQKAKTDANLALRKYRIQRLKDLAAQRVTSVVNNTQMAMSKPSKPFANNVSNDSHSQVKERSLFSGSPIKHRSKTSGSHLFMKQDVHSAGYLGKRRMQVRTSSSKKKQCTQQISRNLVHIC